MQAIAITYPFPIGQPTGGARATREIARYLGRSGVKVFVLTVSSKLGVGRYPRPTADKEFLGFEFDLELKRDSVEIVRVAPNRFHWRLDGLEVRKALGRLLKEESLQAVLSQFHEAAFLPGFLKRRNIRFGFICLWQSYELALHGRNHGHSLSRSINGWIDQLGIVKPHRQAQILFAVSKFTGAELIDILGVRPSRIQINYLGVDPAFTTIPRPEGRSITRIIFLGRFVALKGVFDAITALGRLAARGVLDWEFRMFGQGEQRPLLQAIRRAGIEEKTSVGAALVDRALFQELAQADLALMPSRAEAFGLAFAEAQAAGLPVVAYRAGSVPEVVENGLTGWLVEPGSIDALADSLQEAIEDPSRTAEMGQAARRRVKALFKWENTSAAILAGLERLGSDQRRSVAPLK